MIETRKTTKTKWIVRYGPALTIFTVWLLWSWPQITGASVVGFRDSAYLYFPYFQWIDAQWEAGEIPLWNPFCDLGYPVVADGSSSVFYPGKLIFFLRSLSYPTRYGLYISIHVLLAAIGTFRLARQLKIPPVGATLAAVSYAFGGSVLFQSTNVIYLVSASLLPFAIAAILASKRSHKIRYPITFGAVLALMILGGDPQMAYMVLMIACAVQLSHLFRLSRRPNGRKHWIASAVRRAKSLALALVVLLILGAIQIFPTYVWSHSSSRARASEFSGRALLDDPAKRSAASAVYQFSQPPWTMGELIWPNISGSPFPIHQRWAQHLPGADRMWTPSLYIGLSVLLFAFASARLWGTQRRQIRLTWIGLVFAFGAFGWYGGVWLWKEVVALGTSGSIAASELGSPVGGVYWAMLSVLPKFYLFRYPAKLFVVASLMLSLLGGIGLGRIQKSYPSIIVTSIIIGLVSGLGLVLLMLYQPPIDHGYADALFGPLDTNGAVWSIAMALCHAITMSLILCVSMSVCISRSAWARQLPWGLLALAVIDLCIANGRLVPLIDSNVFTSPRIKNHGDNGVVRLATPIEAWRIKSSDCRLEEILHWQRQSLYPKHHLGIPVRLLGSFSSISHPDNESMLGLASQAAPAAENGSKPLLTQAVKIPGPTRYFRMTVQEFQRFSVSRRNETQFAWEEFLDGEPESLAMGQVSNHHFHAVVSGAEEFVIIWMTLPITGWQTEISNHDDGRRLNVNHNSVGRYAIGVQLPPGTWQIRFRYSPMEFWWGAGLSLCGWLGLLLFVVQRRLRSMITLLRQRI